MRPFITLLAIALLCMHHSFAQQVEFINTYGISGPASGGRDIIAMPDGSITIAATQSISPTPASATNILLMRVAANGDTVWTKRFGHNASFHRAEAITQLSNGNLLIAGNTRAGSTPQDALLICTDAQGNLLWEKTYGGPGAEFATAIKEAGNGFVIGGGTNGSGAGDFDAWLVRTNADGDTLWTRTFGGYEYDDCWDMELTPEGGYMLTGGTYSFASGQLDDAWLVKVDPQGDMIWRRTYGLTDRVDWAWSLTPVQTGGVISGYVFVGIKNTEEDMPGAANGDLHFVKVDTAGNVVWDNSIDGTNGSFRKEGVDVKQLSDGRFIISGFQFTNAAQQLYIVMANENGAPVWDTSIGDNQAFMPWGVTVTNNGSCFITGSMATSAPSQHVFLAKISGMPTNIKGISGSRSYINIYPNPARNSFNIEVPANTRIDKVEIYDPAGQLIKDIDGNELLTMIVDIQGMHAPILFVKVFTSGGVFTRTLQRTE